MAAPHVLISALLDGGERERKARELHSMMQQLGVNAFLLANDGNSAVNEAVFGLTNASAMISLCFDGYGAKSAYKYDSYYELQYASARRLPIVPLKMCAAWPPDPVDHDGGFLGRMQNETVFQPHLLYLDWSERPWDAATCAQELVEMLAVMYGGVSPGKPPPPPAAVEARAKDTEICPKCKRLLPIANMLLHSTRCPGTASTSSESPSGRRAAPWLSEKDLSAFENLSLELPDAQPRPLSRVHSDKWKQSQSTGDGALRCRVSNAVEELEMLNEAYGWVPGRAHVRPNDDVRAQKALLMSNLGTMWASNADWVFHHIFGSSTTRGRDGKRRAERPPPGSTFFAPNPFPYQVPHGTEHWVLWMASPAEEWPDDVITKTIAAEVDERGGGQFVWYPNPKMSIGDPNLHHVQTFWRPAAADC